MMDTARCSKLNDTIRLMNFQNVLKERALELWIIVYTNDSKSNLKVKPKTINILILKKW